METGGEDFVVSPLRQNGKENRNHDTIVYIMEITKRRWPFLPECENKAIAEEHGMRIAVLGDIHANVDALWAMLDVIDRQGVDAIYCAGDVVGYGAAPGECINLLIGRGIPCVQGNHDHYVARPERMSTLVRDEAAQVVHWTRKMLDDYQLKWLDSLPMSLELGDMQICHASCQPWPEWSYVVSARRAAMHFLYQRCRLCFTAHSHVPLLGFHKAGRTMTLEFFRNMVIPRNMAVMVGVGAVGQPRDDDPRACAILYNTTANTVSMLRVKYDVEAAQKRIRDAGLPDMLAQRLGRGQ